MWTSPNCLRAVQARTSRWAPAFPGAVEWYPERKRYYSETMWCSEQDNATQRQKKTCTKKTPNFKKKGSFWRLKPCLLWRMSWKEICISPSHGRDGWATHKRAGESVRPTQKSFTSRNCVPSAGGRHRERQEGPQGLCPLRASCPWKVGTSILSCRWSLWSRESATGPFWPTPRS